MALMTWGPAFSIKVKQFDNQHIKIVNLVNELHDAMKVGKGKDVLGKIFNELISYTATHFADEEKVLAQYAYPDLAQHKAIHANLVKQVLDLQQKFASDKPILTNDVMVFLKDWLVKHIQGDDMKYGAYLNTKGVV